MVFTFLIMAILIFADQWIKFWAQTKLVAAGGYMPLWGKFVELRYVQNTGAAFSIGENSTLFFIIFTTIMLICIMVLILHLYKRKIHLLHWSLVLIMAGGIGNLIDRICYGYVVDMFNFAFFDFPVFNFADVIICIGTGLLFLFILFFYDKYFDDKKKEEQIDEPSEGEDGAGI